jgi:hypothetical protein
MNKRFSEQTDGTPVQTASNVETVADVFTLSRSVFRLSEEWIGRRQFV